MELKQASIFGNYIKIGRKKRNTPRNKDPGLKDKIRLLYGMYEKLYEQQNVKLFEIRDFIIKNNIAIYPDDRQAEPIELQRYTIYDIDERIKRMREYLIDTFRN